MVYRVSWKETMDIIEHFLSTSDDATDSERKKMNPKIPNVDRINIKKIYGNLIITHINIITSSDPESVLSNLRLDKDKFDINK